MVQWKFSGDEILFHAELRKYIEVATHIAAFKSAVRSHSAMWRSKKTPLSLKATAWIAGFPVTNREISQKKDDDLDFIGPSIDLGFRIAKFATSRRFILSPDLALMLLDAVHQLEAEWEDFQVILHGKEELKGVVGGKPFPITWLDMRDGIDTIEDELLGTRNNVAPHKMRQYLQEFLDDTPKLRRPFIDGDNDAGYGELPVGFDDQRDSLMADERMYSESGISDPEEGDVATDPIPEPKKKSSS